MVWGPAQSQISRKPAWWPALHPFLLPPKPVSASLPPTHKKCIIVFSWLHHGDASPLFPIHLVSTCHWGAKLCWGCDGGGCVRGEEAVRERAEATWAMSISSWGPAHGAGSKSSGPKTHLGCMAQVSLGCRASPYLSPSPECPQSWGKGQGNSCWALPWLGGGGRTVLPGQVASQSETIKQGLD